MPAPDLMAAELTLTGRITTASNATFLGSIGATEVVYKPIAGESPLWDFPDGLLAHREVAAYLVSRAFGWDIVPQTWLREGPLGEGMVQLWKEPDAGQSPVDLVPADQAPTPAGNTSSRARMRTDASSSSSTRTRRRCGAWPCST